MATTYINPFVFAGEELGGMVLLTPTSIAYTGTSASIGTNGSVEFTACSSLELRGIFSADYDNYILTLRNQATGVYSPMSVQFLSGTSPETGSNYTRQTLIVDDTFIYGGRNTFWDIRMGYNYDVATSGLEAFFYGPYLAQPTAMRSISANDLSGASILDTAGTHSLSNSYDGFKIFTGGSITGLASVYGLVGA